MGTRTEPFTKKYTVRFRGQALMAPMGGGQVPLLPAPIRERTISAANDEHAILRASRLAYPEETVEITAEDGRRIPV